MAAIRLLAISLVVGALFGWVISTKFPTHHALITGAAAAVFMGGSLAYIERSERMTLTRRSETDDEQDV